MKTLGRFIFWDFPRASWQYDVMVALILVFIFVTPRGFFRDQPKAASIQMLPGERGYWVESRLLEDVPPAERAREATRLIHDRFKTRDTVSLVEPVLDEAEQEITGYIAFTKP